MDDVEGHQRQNDRKREMANHRQKFRLTILTILVTFCIISILLVLTGVVDVEMDFKLSTNPLNLDGLRKFERDPVVDVAAYTTGDDDNEIPDEVRRKPEINLSDLLMMEDFDGLQGLKDTLVEEAVAYDPTRDGTVSPDITTPPPAPPESPAEETPVPTTETSGTSPASTSGANTSNYSLQSETTKQPTDNPVSESLKQPKPETEASKGIPLTEEDMHQVGKAHEILSNHTVTGYIHEIHYQSGEPSNFSLAERLKDNKNSKINDNLTPQATALGEVTIKATAAQIVDSSTERVSDPPRVVNDSNVSDKFSRSEESNENNTTGKTTDSYLIDV